MHVHKHGGCSSPDQALCSCDKKSTYLVSFPGCTDDESAVAALPDDWVPKHSGPILKNYLKQREEQHDNVHNDILDAAAVVNSAIDDKVQVLAQNLMDYIKGNQRDMDCCVERLDKGSALSKEARDEALKEIFQLHALRLQDMATFKRQALALERERADGLRVVLRDHFQKLVGVGHRTPKDLLHDFDEKVYEINQQLLSNSRAYSELEAQLRVQADESLVRARSAINELCLGITTRLRGQSAVSIGNRQRLSCLRPLSAVEKKRLSSPENNIDDLVMNMETFDERISTLVQAYKMAVKSVLDSLFDKLFILEKDLGIHHQFLDHEKSKIGGLTDLKDVIDNTLKNLSISLHKKQLCNIDLVEATSTQMLTMQRSLRSLGECLQDTYTVLHDAGHLWDAHILRQAHAQKLTIAAVEDLLTSNDSIQQANEVNFNIALEQLRASSDFEKLSQNYDIVFAMLETIATMYREQSEAELGRLQEFMNLPKALANILLSEFECFLEKHPRLHTKPENINRSNTSIVSPSRSIHESLSSPLPRVILQTELQEIALRNWRNGFLESFQTNVGLVPDELKRQARLWVEERGSALHMRYSLKMVSHCVRLERIKAARDIRFAELQNHETRLEAHLRVINELIDSLPGEVSVFSGMDDPHLYPFLKWINKIYTDIQAFLENEPTDPEVKRLKFSSYPPRLEKHRALFEESVNAAMESFKRQIDYRIQNSRISNVRFMSQIKLFKEGGRYAAQEAIKTVEYLAKGADVLESSVVKVLDSMQQRRQNLLNQADELLAPVQKLISDNYNKNVPKAKIHPSAKK